MSKIVRTFLKFLGPEHVIEMWTLPSASSTRCKVIVTFCSSKVNHMCLLLFLKHMTWTLGSPRMLLFISLIYSSTHSLSLIAGHRTWRKACDGL